MDLIFIFVILAMILPAIGQSMLEGQRKAIISAIEKKRKTRVIVLIHRQEVMNFLGFPIAKFISIEDSERLLRAIHLTPPDMPIDLILHTPGGLVLAAQQIARALTRHQAKVTVFVPHYAMSGGTMLALAADEIIMDENAVLGPIDPQIGNMPAASLLKLVEAKPVEKLSDETLIMVDIANKSVRQVDALLRKILLDHVPEVKVQPENIPKIAQSLVSGMWTHDHPITVEDAQELELPVKTGLPEELYALMDLYPQASGTKSSVQYIPLPYKIDPKTPAPLQPPGTSN